MGGRLVKIQTSGPKAESFMGWTWEPASLTSSQVMLMLLAGNIF